MRHHRLAPTRALIVLLLATGLLAGSAVVAGTVYKWKDANGQSHYSQQPPDGVKKYETISGASDAWANNPSASPAASSPHDAGSASAKPAAAAGQTPAQQQRAQLCAQARANVTTLNQHATVSADVNGDGKPVTLNAAQHDKALSDANKQVDLYCSQ